MNAEVRKNMLEAIRSRDEGMDLMREMIAVAAPSKVFSEPLASGDHRVITAAEVHVGLGYGFGIGGGEGPTAAAAGEAAEEGASAGSPRRPPEGGAGGGGGGGGGASMARPVAVIDITPAGVRVEPVLDLSKIALAIVPVLASLIMLMGRMMRH